MIEQQISQVGTRDVSNSGQIPIVGLLAYDDAKNWVRMAMPRTGASLPGRGGFVLSMLDKRREFRSCVESHCGEEPDLINGRASAHPHGIKEFTRTPCA